MSPYLKGVGPLTVKLFQRVLFCWVTGNGDMHLKNWSLIEKGPLVVLSPAYDLLNTKVLINDEDESALTLADRKSGFDRNLLVEYFGREVCRVNERMIEKTLSQFEMVDWNSRILGSHLQVEIAQQYNALVLNRLKVLSLEK